MPAFFFHYNKPASKKANKPVISLHFQKQCYLVDNIIVNVPTKGKIRKTQPFFVITGKAKQIEIKDNVAYLSNT